MGAFHKVASAKDLPPGGVLGVGVEGHRIALFNVEGTIYAVGETCTHSGGPLSEGLLAAGTVVCPWHGAEFDVRTGEAIGPPAEDPIPCHRVRLSGADIEIEI